MAIPVHDVPVGYGFRPTDEELISHYLRLKIDGHDQEVEIIREIDLSKHEPWDLPYLSVLESTNDQWFFFNQNDWKYEVRRRIMNRTTQKGYWKGSGATRSITSSIGEHIGSKRTLIFYIGRRPKGKKSNWVIHEYHASDKSIDGTHHLKGHFAICRLFKIIKMEEMEIAETSRFNEVEDETDTPVLPTDKMEGNILDTSSIQFDPNPKILLGDLSTLIQMQVAAEFQKFSSLMQAQLAFSSNNLNVDHDFNNNQHNIPSHVPIAARKDNLLDTTLTANLDYRQEATEWEIYYSLLSHNNFSVDHDFNNLISQTPSQFQSSSKYNNFSDDHDFNNFQHSIPSQYGTETFECLTSVRIDPEEQSHGNIRAISYVDGSSTHTTRQ